MRSGGNMSGSPQLRVELISVDDLTEYDGNARAHGREDIEAIEWSIQQFGFNDPIGIWSKDNVIVEGHGRLKAAKNLGMTEVPCIRLDHMTDEQRRAYALAHNKTAELSAWDFDKLDLEIAGIHEFDMTKIGFMANEEVEEAVDDNYMPDPPKNPKSKLGDVYQLGDHVLVCGDSTDPEIVKKATWGGYYAGRLAAD